MRRFLFVLIVSMLAATPARAHSVTARYDIASTPVVGFVCPYCFATPYNLGGFTFLPTNSEIPARVSIADVTGTAAAFLVCQDLDGDAACGESWEPAVRGCGEGSLIEQHFVPWIRTTVFVYSVAAACPAGIGTRGTITLTYDQ